MAALIGGFLGLLAGFIVWKMIGGTLGFLLAIVAVPLASALFIGLFTAIYVVSHARKRPASSQTPEPNSTSAIAGTEKKE
jgi:hypothetical protein